MVDFIPYFSILLLSVDFIQLTPKQHNHGRGAGGAAPGGERESGITVTLT